MNRLSLLLAICLLAAVVVMAHPNRKLIARSQSPANSQDTSGTLDEAKRLNATVVELYKAHHYDEAIPLAKRVVEIREKLLGNDVATGAAYMNLGELYLVKQNYSAAEAAYERVLSIYESFFGADKLDDAPIIQTLAFINYLKGNFTKAETLYQKSLSIREQAGETADLAKAALEMGEFYRSRREYKKAEPYFLRAIEINDRVLKKDDPEFVRTLQRYDCFIYESKGVTEGQKQLKEFEEVRRAKSGTSPATPGSGGVLNGRALSLPAPDYPLEAKTIRASGVVMVEVKIDTEGNVIDAHSVCGPAVFARVAVAAALKAKFSPTHLSGAPVQVNGIIIYNFVGH
jgi:TonB family protein